MISHIMPDGAEKPVAFASRTLISSERNYAKLEEEALALVLGVKRFHQYLYLEIVEMSRTTTQERYYGTCLVCLNKLFQTMDPNLFQRSSNTSCREIKFATFVVLRTTHLQIG